MDTQQCTLLDSQGGANTARPMKGFDLCGPLTKPPDCLLNDLIALAKKASAAVGVYARIDLFASGVTNQVYVQEYTMNHMNGIRHCMAQSTASCIDPCYLGVMWQNAGGNATFGGGGVTIPASLLDQMTGVSTRCAAAAAGTNLKTSAADIPISTCKHASASVLPSSYPPAMLTESPFPTIRPSYAVPSKSPVSSIQRTTSPTASPSPSTSPSAALSDQPMPTMAPSGLPSNSPAPTPAPTSSPSTSLIPSIVPSYSTPTAPPFHNRPPDSAFPTTPPPIKKWHLLGDDIDGYDTDSSGESVALSADGRTVAIGAHVDFGDGTDSENGFDVGHVRMFAFDGTSWNQLGLDIDGEATLDLFGTSVSLSSDGETVAMAATHNIRVYAFNVTSWSQLGMDLDGEEAGGWFGSSPVSLSADGNTVAVADRAGHHARVYAFNGTSWNQLGMDLDGEAAIDQSGSSVSLSSDGKTVAIGAVYIDGSGRSVAGHVRVYGFDGFSWNQLGMDIDGEAADDRSGWSVSLSSDGKTVAIGAPYNDGNGSGVSGHVRVYAFDGSSWNQVGMDLDAEAGSDRSGWSVSLSSDGNAVAIGAEGGTTSDVHVYELY